MASRKIFNPVVEFTQCAGKKIHIFMSMTGWFVSDTGDGAGDVFDVAHGVVSFSISSAILKHSLTAISEAFSALKILLPISAFHVVDASPIASKTA